MSASTERVAVVTGAGRGIGREIARQLVARGFLVLVTDLDLGMAGSTAEELESALGRSFSTRAIPQLIVRRPRRRQSEGASRFGLTTPALCAQTRHGSTPTKRCA